MSERDQELNILQRQFSGFCTSEEARLQDVSAPPVLPEHCPVEHELPVAGLVVQGDHLATHEPHRERVKVGAEQTRALGVDAHEVALVELDEFVRGVGRYLVGLRLLYRAHLPVPSWNLKQH